MQRSMRVRSTWKLFALAAAATCWAGSAHASSIVTLEAMTEPLGPSMVVAGTPDAPADAVETDDRRMVSRSIVAFGTPAVTYENVASVGEKPDRQRRGFSPMVLRGGIFGGSFPSTSSPQPVQASVPAEARPQARKPAPSRLSAEPEGEAIEAPAPESPVTY